MGESALALLTCAYVNAALGDSVKVYPFIYIPHYLQGSIYSSALYHFVLITVMRDRLGESNWPKVI